MFDSMLNLFLLVWLLLVSNLSVWGPQLKVGINLPADASSNLRRRPEMMMMMIDDCYDDDDGGKGGDDGEESDDGCGDGDDGDLKHICDSFKEEVASLGNRLNRKKVSSTFHFYNFSPNYNPTS